MPYTKKASQDQPLKRSAFGSRAKLSRKSKVPITKKLARKKPTSKQANNASFEFHVNSDTETKSVKQNEEDGSLEESSIDPGTDSSAQYDTDLDIVEEKPVFLPYSSTNTYLEQCRLLNIRPVLAVMRTISTDALIVRHAKLNAFDARAIAAALTDNVTVRSIDLEDNLIGSTGAKYIAGMLTNNLYVNKLNLAQNKLDSFGLLALVDVIGSSESMRLLNISGNEFNADDANYILQLLTENFYLKVLDISSNHFGQCSAPILGQAVLANDTLQVLNISNNELGKLHAAKFTSGFKERTDIRDLNLSWNGLGDPGAVGIGAYLLVNADIRSLDITNNNITVTGAASIAKGLKVNASLITLRMGQNPIGSVGALSIITALSLNERSTLRMLDLKDVWVKHDFNDIVNAVRQIKQFDVVIGGILEDFQERPKELAVKMEMKRKSAENIGNRLKDALESDPFIYIAYQLDDKNLPIEEFTTNLPIERRYRTVHISAFKNLLQELDMPEDMMEKLITMIKYKDEKIFIDKFRKLLDRAVKAKRVLISNIGELPEEDEEDPLESYNEGTMSDIMQNLQMSSTATLLSKHTLI